MKKRLRNRLSGFGWPVNPIANVAALLFLCAVVTMAQTPWSTAATRLGTEFTGPIARGFALVAIVVGGLTLAFSEGGGRRTVGGLVFGLGLALGATQFVSALFT